MFCLWVKAIVIFHKGGGVYEAKVFKVENCSYELGCDLLEQLIDGVADQNNWQTARVTIKHKKEAPNARGRRLYTKTT